MTLLLSVSIYCQKKICCIVFGCAPTFIVLFASILLFFTLAGIKELKGLKHEWTSQ